MGRRKLLYSAYRAREIVKFKSSFKMGKNMMILVLFFWLWEKKLAEQSTKGMRDEQEAKRKVEERRKERWGNQRSFNPKSHSRELPMRKREVEGKTIIKWLWVPRDTERNKINGVSQHMTKRPRGASWAEINEESRTQRSQSYDLQVKVVEVD